MAKRNDIYVDLSVSPRIVWIEDTSAEITVQDNHDTLRNIEVEPQNMDDLILVQTAGGEDLGGSVLVGLTSTLQNAQIAFEERTTSKSEGTATSADPTGFYLTDISADFVADGIERGATIINFTDKSACTVIQIMSANQLRCTKLKDGSDNQWEIGDAYKIWNTVQCDITGGNIVAVDTGGTPISSVFPTAFTQVVRTSSASATIAQLEIENIQRLIETQRSSHTAMGDIYYWDPYAGNDDNTGLKPEKPVLTFARAHDLAIDYNHDVIMCQPGNPTGHTVADETLVISKSYLFVRGPGPDFRIIPTATNKPTVEITGNGVELSSLLVQTAGSGGQTAVYVNGGDHALIKDVLIEDPQNHGVHFVDSARSMAHRVEARGAGGQGILVDDNVTELDIKDCNVHSGVNDGICFDGTGIQNCKIRGAATASYDNAGYGIRITSAVQNTLLDVDVTAQSNTLGNVLDDGTQTVYSGLDHSASFQGYVWIDTGSAIVGTQYPRGTPAYPVNNITDARAIADELSMMAFKLRGAITLDQAYTNWRFEGLSSVGSDIVLLNGQNITTSFFSHVTVAGAMAGLAANFQECVVSNLSSADCILLRCGIVGSLTLGVTGTEVLMSQCNAISDPTIFDIVGTDRAIRANVDGDVEIRNVDGTGFVSVGSGYGTVNIASSCVGGGVVVSGVTHVTDNSGSGCNVVRDGQLSGSPQTYRGAVTIDTVNGTPGTNYPIGTPEAPVSNLADARTIADTLGIKRFEFRGTITLDQAYDHCEFYGLSSIEYDVINLDSQDVGQSHFDRATITGIMSCPSGPATIREVFAVDVSGAHLMVMNSAFSGTITLGVSGSYILGDRITMVGSPVVLDMVGSGRVVRIKYGGGDLKVQNIDTGSTLVVDAEAGNIELDSSCVGGSINLTGTANLVDNSGAGCTVTTDDLIVPAVVAQAALIPATV